MRTTLWPTGLIGRVGIVLFAAVMLELIGSTFVFEQAELISSDDAQAKRIAEQLDVAARVLTVTNPGQRGAVAKTLSEPTLMIGWRENQDQTLLPESDARTKSLRRKILENEPTLAKNSLALRADPSDPQHIVEGRLHLVDGSAVVFRATSLGSALPSIYNQFGSIIVLSCCVLLAALLVVRTLAQPLRMLVGATDAIGHGPAVQLDDEQGPREIRRVATAFNAMQDRIAKLVRDRTDALAAVSHDLRTPIARMRLRTGFLAAEDQAAFETDLEEMEAMLLDLNAFLSGDTDPEKPKPTDIAAMLQTLTTNATDAGQRAEYEGPDHLTLTVRALALKRSCANLVNNAIAYAGNVRISLAGREDHVVVIVFKDDGPGIPEAELTQVLEPFFRGDASRNRETGGMGLGLAIARQAVWRHGGTIALANRRQGGLRVTVTLPRRAD